MNKFKLSENVIVLGDYAEYDSALESGHMTRQEYDDFFTNSRFHGLNDTVYPFAVGGSDTAAILGVEGAFKSARFLAEEKLGLITAKHSDKTKELFKKGHIFEPKVRDMFSLESGLETYPETRQFLNKKYPHCVANIDGIVKETRLVEQADGSIKQEEAFGIYEGKKSLAYSSTMKKFKEGLIPPYYITQIAFYMEVLELDFAYITVWGSKPNGSSEMIYLRMDRDKDFGQEIMQQCEKFVENVSLYGSHIYNIPPALFEKESEELFGAGDPYKDDFMLPKESLGLIHRLEGVTKDIKSFKEEHKDVYDAEKALKEEKTKLENKLCEVMAENVKGYIDDSEGTWVLTYEVPDGISATIATMNWIKKNYPDVHKELVSKFPKKRKFGIKRK